MCGIAGLVRFDGEPVGKDAEAMVAAIRHRGPDDTGVAYFDTAGGAALPPSGAERANAALGLARLSIIDLSPAGRQPMANEDGTVWVAFNGELYNFGEVRPWLLSRGHRFRSRSDTEVLIHAYEEEGLGCLTRFRGMFGLALLDLARRRLYLVRDRLGLKPVKYFLDGRLLAFASELKALCAVRSVPRRLDPVAVEEYLTYRYVPAPRTGLEGVQKLPPASILEVNLTTGEHAITRYWSPPRGTALIPDDALPGEAGRRFDEAVALRLIADVPVAVFLSGGLDSSAIVAAAAKVQPGLRTYAVGFDDPGFDERPAARAVAERFGTAHEELLVRPAPAEDLEPIVRAFDEPFADPSAVPTYYLSRAVARHVKVVLSGDGGDELFGGYKRYAVHLRTCRWQRWLPRRRAWLWALAQASPFHPDKKRWPGRLGRLLLEASLPYARAYQLRFSGLDPRFRMEIRGEWLRDQTRDYDPLDRLAQAFAACSEADPGARLQNVDLVTYLPDDILPKSDLAGMAHGLEVRCPFLDHRFVEFAVQLPAAWRARKTVQRAMLEGVLPPALLARKKMGFNPPLAGWLRGELAPQLRELLLPPGGASARLFRPALVREMVDYHLEGRGDLSEPLWLLLVLHVWVLAFGVSL